MPKFGRKVAVTGPQQADKGDEKQALNDKDDGHYDEVEGTPNSPTIGVDAFTEEALDIKKRSVLAYLAGAAHRDIDDGDFPTNEELVQARFWYTFPVFWLCIPTASRATAKLGILQQTPS